MGKKNKGNRGGGGGNRPDAVAATATKPEIVKAEAQAETPTPTSTNPILTEKPVENGPIIGEIISTPVQVIQEEVQSPKTTEEDAPTKNQTKKNKKNSKQNKQQPAEIEQCVKLEQPVTEEIGKHAPGATQEEDKSITISSEKQLGSEDNAASKKKKKNRNKNKGNEEKPQNIAQPQPSEAKTQNIEDNQALKIENIPQTLSKTQMKKLKKLQRQQEAELLNQESKLQSEVKEVITPLCDNALDLTNPKQEPQKITNTNKKANKESKTIASPHTDNKKEQEKLLISIEDQTKIQEKSHPGITLVKKTSSNENILIEKYPNADNLAAKAIQINKIIPKPEDSKTQDHTQKTLIQLEEKPIKEIPVNTKQTHKGNKSPKNTEEPTKGVNLVKASSNTDTPLKEEKHPKITEKPSKDANLVKASSNTESPLREDQHPKITEKPSKDANLVKASSNTESPLREDQHPKITEKPSKEANLVKASSNTDTPLKEDKHPKITEKPSKDANLVKASSNTESPLREDQHPKITEKPSKDANLVKASSNTDTPLKEVKHPKITEKPSKDASLVKASSNTESPLREDQHPKITEKPSKDANLVKALSNTDTPLKEDKHPKITDKPSKDLVLIKSSDNTEIPLKSDSHPQITENLHKESKVEKNAINCECLDNTSEKSEAKLVTCKDNKSQESSCQNKNLQPNAGKSNKGRKSPKPQNKQPMQIKNNKQINETSKEPCLTEQVPLSSPQLVSSIDAKIHEAAPSNIEKSCSQQKRKSPTKGMNKAKQQNQQEEKEKPSRSFSQSNSSEKVNEPLSKTLEKSLENISTVPDAEIIKLFDLVSKDIEKEVEPTLQEKLSTFSVPIAQAGAALANLIDVVEKTEHKIKESVEETKAKEKSKSQSPQSTPKPTAKSDLCKPIDQKDLNDVLSDAILVEATDCLPQTPPLSNNTITEDNPVITKEPVRTGDQPIEIPEQTPSRKSSTDSKNVVRSDFAPSVEVINEDLVQKTGVKSLLNHASEKLTPKQNIGVQTKISTSPDKTGPVTKPKVPPRPEITKTKFKPIVQAKPKTIPPPPLKRPPPIPQSDDEDEEELIEFKFSPRKVFLFTLCQVCQASLVEYTFCPDCQMVAYCGEQHLKDDVQHHKPYCAVIQEIAKKRGGHVYNNAKILSHNDFRNLRVHTLNICESMLKRQLQAYEKEILLFPRLCTKPDCRNWKINELTECNKCRQVTFCKANDQHLSPNHGDWCSKFLLYQKLVIRQKTVGRIEPPLPSRICTQTFVLNQPIQDVFKELYKNNAVLNDDCAFATLTQLATGPLTTLCAAQTCGMDIGESFVIHLIGAELQFEGESLDKWEAFFLHLIPKLTDLRVVFVGPELNNENLPIEILSRIRMCRMCRTTCRNVKFDFQCGKLYHDYANTNAFTKPDLICFFNPGLYRMTGFCGLDTWPDTIKCAVRQNCPIVVTSYTELESPLDLSQLQKMGNGVNERQLRLIQPPKINPYSSQRPERNFVSDEIAPMIFKNYYHFVVN